MKLAAIADLGEALDGRELVGAGAGPDGALWAVGTRGKRSMVLRADENGVERVCELDGVIHCAQPLGDGILVANARRRSRAPNARVVTRDGKTRASFALGDAIAALQTTFDRQIWCGYFDEGVFGDDPIGSNGLCAFDAGGTHTFSYDANACGTDLIFDCYALNVADDDNVWLYFYDEFALVHLRKRRAAGVWKCPIRGAHAFAVDGARVLMTGGYDAKTRFGEYRLENKRMVRAADRRFSGEDDAALGARCFGRGSQLHFVDGTRWYRVDLRELAWSQSA